MSRGAIIGFINIKTQLERGKKKEKEDTLFRFPMTKAAENQNERACFPGFPSFFVNLDFLHFASCVGKIKEKELKRFRTIYLRAEYIRGLIYTVQIAYIQVALTV